jgi:hypothetical protein
MYTFQCGGLCCQQGAANQRCSFRLPRNEIYLYDTSEIYLSFFGAIESIMTLNVFIIIFDVDAFQ